MRTQQCSFTIYKGWITSDQLRTKTWHILRGRTRSHSAGIPSNSRRVELRSHLNWSLALSLRLTNQSCPKSNAQPFCFPPAYFFTPGLNGRGGGNWVGKVLLPDWGGGSGTGRQSEIELASCKSPKHTYKRTLLPVCWDVVGCHTVHWH